MTTLFYLACFALPILFPFGLGVLVGRERGWKRAAKHFAQREAELQRQVSDLQRCNADWKRYCDSLTSYPVVSPTDSESVTFTVHPGDPTALARACQITASRLANRNNPQNPL
jgi:hypothetical protein